MEYYNPELTEGEEKIIRALQRLDKLWEKYGEDLILFNGNDLRKGGYSCKYGIDSFPNIRGGGGDGGDNFD